MCRVYVEELSFRTMLSAESFIFCWESILLLTAAVILIQCRLGEQVDFYDKNRLQWLFVHSNKMKEK